MRVDHLVKRFINHCIELYGIMDLPGSDMRRLHAINKLNIINILQ